MSSEISSDVKFEIGHVLFIDIVGFSKLLIDDQSEQIQKVKKIIREAEQFRLAEARGELVRLPTGDGAALVFRRSFEAPVLCAIEIHKELRKHPEIPVRMGIHSGAVNELADLNEQINMAGAGINLAQRVMACADAGHILISRHVAEDLEQYPRWRPYLHELGECKVKHGLPIGVFNFYDDEVGNPRLPKKFRELRQHRARARWAGFATALLLVAAIAGLLSIFSRNRVEVLPVRPEKSIAVLPFENRSNDPGNTYFADGVQEEILMRLSKIADLKVISRTSTQRFKSSPDDLAQIAKQLGVANLLEGSVQRAAGKVRVNVQLINATTSAHLWAESFDRNLGDIFAVESDIAKSIADTLQAKLSGAEKTAISTKPTENPEAYELYLKGRFFWSKRTAADLQKAIEFFNQALGKDPAYALAYVGLADCYQVSPGYGAASSADSFPKAKAAAEKAVELDPTLAEAHTSLANILSDFDFDFEESIKEFERAIQLNPNYATAHQWYANGPLVALGQFDRAIAEAKRAVELDPLSLIINANLGNFSYFYARRYDEAIIQLRKTIEMDPRFPYAHGTLGQALQLKRQLSEAIAEYRKAVELNDDPSLLALLGQGYARAGQRDEAQKILMRLNEEAKSRYVHAYSFALMYLALGDKEHAIDQLERSYRDREPEDAHLIRVDPLLDDLRGHPRFEALVQEIFAPKR
jgi:TolB-like protein/Tfp pilus assembly protein PilF/class 3 adenylate cyclase